jgi:hypothetical protein
MSRTPFLVRALIATAPGETEGTRVLPPAERRADLLTDLFTFTSTPSIVAVPLYVAAVASGDTQAPDGTSDWANSGSPLP